MRLQEISIEVPPEVARAFACASEEDRRLAIHLFGTLLRPRNREQDLREFEAATRKLSDEAKASGLTEEALAEILADKQ